ncbi:hypothetical protein SDC9_159857 [bioreactor metagenome]|uniref:Uncharacterized protein n=1 Tax=bioreactor metagenome TaxID=1076179 RepID=A0A645FGQ5_9ZZZZ
MRISGDGAVVITLVVVNLLLPVAEVQIGDAGRPPQIDGHAILVAETENHVEQIFIFRPGGRARILGRQPDAALFGFGADDEQLVHADGFHHPEILLPLLQAAIHDTRIGNQHIDESAGNRFQNRIFQHKTLLNLVKRFT